MNKLHLGLAAVLMAAGFAGGADAATINNTASGSVTVLPTNGGAGQVFGNLLLGDPGRANYLVFDLSSLANQTIGSATLTITAPGFYSSSDASEHFALWDYSGNVSTLASYSFSNPPDAATAAAVRTDLSSGLSYGSVDIAKPANGALPNIVVTLSADAIANINSKLGSASHLFAIGGSSDTLGTNQYLFQTSGGGAGIAQLDLQPVPLPAGIWLLVSGLMGLGAAARKRQQAVAV